MAAEIAALLQDIPRGQVDDQTRATWFDRKAAIFDAIAQQGGHDADEARCASAHARREAEHLRRGDP